MTKKKTLVGWVYVKKTQYYNYYKKGQQEKNEVKHTNILSVTTNKLDTKSPFRL